MFYWFFVTHLKNEGDISLNVYINLIWVAKEIPDSNILKKI